MELSPLSVPIVIPLSMDHQLSKWPLTFWSPSLSETVMTVGESHLSAIIPVYWRTRTQLSRLSEAGLGDWASTIRTALLYVDFPGDHGLG